MNTAGAKLLLVGDHRQLVAIGAGGGMDLLAQAGTRYELVEAVATSTGRPACTARPPAQDQFIGLDDLTCGDCRDLVADHSPGKTKKSGQPACVCGRRIRVAMSVLAAGPILCGSAEPVRPREQADTDDAGGGRMTRAGVLFVGLTGRPPPSDRISNVCSLELRVFRLAGRRPAGSADLAKGCRHDRSRFSCWGHGGATEGPRRVLHPGADRAVCDAVGVAVGR